MKSYKAIISQNKFYCLYVAACHCKSLGRGDMPHADDHIDWVADGMTCWWSWSSDAPDLGFLPELSPVISTLAPSWQLADHLCRISPDSGCSSGSVHTLWHTSDMMSTVRPLSLLCLNVGILPMGQVNTTQAPALRHGPYWSQAVAHPYIKVMGDKDHDQNQ